jgi:hypothetical protein
MERVPSTEGRLKLKEPNDRKPQDSFHHIKSPTARIATLAREEIYKYIAAEMA